MIGFDISPYKVARANVDSRFVVPPASSPDYEEKICEIINKEKPDLIIPTNDPEVDQTSKNVTIDHFAFNVTRENFEKAKKRYDDLGLDYIFRDHHYFDSIYTQDPDGHTVELTTIKVNERDFYK